MKSKNEVKDMAKKKPGIEESGDGIKRYLPKDYAEKLKKCPTCGKLFKGRGVKDTKKGRRYWGNKKYCSDYCRYKAWAKRNPRVSKWELEAFRMWKNGQNG